MKKRVTLQDIAQLTKTSTSTVSRVLTGKGYVSPDVREKILETMKNEGYAPQKEHKKKTVTDMVMVVASQLASEVQVKLVNAIQERLNQEQMKTAIISVDFDSPELYEYIEYAQCKDFAGIILLGALDTEKLRKSMCRLKCPVVMLNQRIGGVRASIVKMQDYEGGCMATQYLLQKGHKKIAFLNGYANAVAIQEREQGYIDTVIKAGLDTEGVHVIYKDFSMQEGRNFADEIFCSGFPYTAVIVANDLMGIGLITRLQELKVKVPDQLSIVVFGDTLLTQLCTPSITTLKYDFDKMGISLADLLLERIEKIFLKEQIITFSPQLIERESVATLSTKIVSF